MTRTRKISPNNTPQHPQKHFPDISSVKNPLSVNAYERLVYTHNLFSRSLCLSLKIRRYVAIGPMQLHVFNVI